MPLFLLDRDGVVVVNRKDSIKTPAGLQPIAGAAEAIARLNGAGFDVGAGPWRMACHTMWSRSPCTTTLPARSTPTFATCRGVATFLQGHERASGRN